MILDYEYNKYKREMSISYVDERGHKKVIRRNVSRFKSYKYDENGTLPTWNGKKCSTIWKDGSQFNERTYKFDVKTYIRELSKTDFDLINGTTFPKLYTFDIEVEISKDGSFPEPTEGRMPITTISITNPDFDTIVLGTRDVFDEERIRKKFDEYLENSQYFKSLKVKKKPTFRYIKFDSEEGMLRYFFSNIVAKVPILCGWNSLLFDWMYIVNRVRNHFPNLALSPCSCTGQLVHKSITDLRDNKYIIPVPAHTVILDMMQVIRDEDYVVMPIKESYGLDYIAHESIGINKIEYSGTLQDLYERDYDEYVFYNSIDSVIVQLLDHRFRTMDHIYMYALYCLEKIDKCFSKIATTEALVFQSFYDRGLKIVYEDRDDIERGKLQGAYVKKPIAGLHSWICCNDFASLYPSTIRTCNLSFENYMCNCWDEEKLDTYRNNPEYITVGPNVYKNEGTATQPKMGDFVCDCVDREGLQQYSDTSKYFCSVNGSVYLNDRDYTFRQIQATLKANRDASKYLSKKLEATVYHDMMHILEGRECEDNTYSEDVVNACKKIGLVAENSGDLKKLSETELNDYAHELHKEIVYYSCHEQAMKLLMNSMYGGSSHVSFYWFNMCLANDITGESRNLIHMMEHHIPKFWSENWLKLTHLHKALDIEIDEAAAQRALESSPLITEAIDKHAYHGHSYVVPVYGDTDSIYLSYKWLLDSIKGVDKMSIERKRSILAYLNTEFMDQHNEEFIREYYNTRGGKSTHKFELETIALSGVWLNVKKRYGQILVWKDGNEYDVDDLPLKIKGLEVVKSSFPSKSRSILKHLIKFLLEHADDRYINQKINIEAQKCKQEFYSAPIDEISGAVKINNYDKYVLDDTGAKVKWKPVRSIPWNVRALAQYNQIRQYRNLPGEPIYGGKCSWYITTNSNKENTDYFAFTSHNWPSWAEKYANINKPMMFAQTVLDPINRILTTISLNELHEDGSLQIDLF